MLDSDEVRRLLPQSYPFVFVDRVLEFEPGVRIVCEKDITGDEPFFRGHFREIAVMPGALTGEAMSQSAILLFRLSQEGCDAGRDDDHVFVVGSTRTRFLQPIFPGDTLLMEVLFDKLLSASAMVTGIGRVNGRDVIKTSLTLAVVELQEMRRLEASRAQHPKEANE